MANMVYTRGKFKVLSDALLTADLRVLLVQSTYVEDAAHNVVADVVAFELSVGSYARQALVGVTVTEDDSGLFGYLDANDVAWNPLNTGQTIGGAIVFVHTGNDATAPLLAYFDLTNTPTNNGNFSLQWAVVANGGVLKVA